MSDIQVQARLSLYFIVLFAGLVCTVVVVRTIYLVVLCYSPGAIGLGGRLFGEDDLRPVLTRVNCTGGEPNLQECPIVTGNQEILSCDSAIVVCQCM